MKKTIAICILCFMLLSIISCDITNLIPITPDSSTDVPSESTSDNTEQTPADTNTPQNDNSTDKGGSGAEEKYIYPDSSYVGEWCMADDERSHVTVYSVSETEMEFEITLKCRDNDYYSTRCTATYKKGDSRVFVSDILGNASGYLSYYDVGNGEIGIIVTITDWNYDPALDNTSHIFSVRTVTRPDESILGLWDQGSYPGDTLTVYAYRNDGFDFILTHTDENGATASYYLTAKVTRTSIAFVSKCGNLHGMISFGGDTFDVMYLRVYSTFLKGTYRFEQPEFFEPTEIESYIEPFTLHNYSTADLNSDIVINPNLSLYIRGIGDSAISLTYKYQWGSRVYYADESGTVIANILICERRISRNASSINKIQCMVLTIDVGTVSPDERVFLFDFDGALG